MGLQLFQVNQKTINLINKFRLVYSSMLLQTLKFIVSPLLKNASS